MGQRICGAIIFARNMENSVGYIVVSEEEEKAAE